MTTDEWHTIRHDPDLPEALISAYAILSLLHYRGLHDTPLNRGDVDLALSKLRPFALAAEKKAMDAK